MDTGYTILEVAKGLGVSKNTIKGRMRNLPPDAIYKEQRGNQTRVMITQAGYDILMQHRQRELEAAALEPVRVDAAPATNDSAPMPEQSEPATETGSTAPHTPEAFLFAESLSAVKEAYAAATAVMQAQIDQLKQELKDQEAKAQEKQESMQHTIDELNASLSKALDRIADAQNGQNFAIAAAHPETMKQIAGDAAIDQREVEPEQEGTPATKEQKKASFWSWLFGQ